MLIPLGILSSAGAGGAAAGTYELIQSSILTSDTASVTFSSIPQTYRHLQIRFVARDDRNAFASAALIRFNSDTASNYSEHALYAGGSSVISFSSINQTRILLDGVTALHTVSNAFGAGVCEILDYSSNSKNTTIRSLGGNNDPISSAIALRSGLWINTAAVTTISLTPLGTNFITGSRFSLYGIKG